jgi:hypothetical protein
MSNEAALDVRSWTRYCDSCSCDVIGLGDVKSKWCLTYSFVISSDYVKTVCVTDQLNRELTVTDHMEYLLFSD